MKSNYLIGVILILVVIAAVILVLNPQILNSITNQPVLNNNNLVVPATKEFVVTAKNYQFSPTEIRVNQGDQVKIIFKNTEGTHDWKLDEFNVGTSVIGIEQEESLTFTANRQGTFEYYCSVGNHRQMGMVGSLIVQ